MGEALRMLSKAFSLHFTNVAHDDCTCEFTCKKVNVFEICITLSGLCKVSLAATSPRRLQLCKMLLSSVSQLAVHYSVHTPLLRAEGC